MLDYVKRALLVALIAAIGLAVGLSAENLHRHLSADASYTSFCNINSAVNCDRVLSSQWAQLGGISVALLAVIFYAAVAALGLATCAVKRAAQRRRIADILLLLASGGLLFSLYMGWVAIVILGTVCLMCSALYVVAVALFVAVWWLRSSLEITARRDLATRRLRDVRVTLIGAAAVAAVLFGVAWKSLTAAPKLSTAQEVRNNDPKFVDWFEQQPHVNIEANVGNVRGSDTAAVTLIEFSDFECSHCNAFHRTIDELLRDRSAAVRVIFRHFPLDSECNSAVTSRFHSNACQAAIAAECAAEQGKFWQYHDLLFANQEHLQAQSYLEFAAQLGIDRGRFETCLRADAPRARVERDAKAGAVLGVSSTPTIFINARMIKGALDIAELQKALILAASEPR